MAIAVFRASSAAGLVRLLKMESTSAISGRPRVGVLLRAWRDRLKTVRHEQAFGQRNYPVLQPGSHYL